jgi:hypothetical protein
LRSPLQRFQPELAPRQCYPESYALSRSCGELSGDVLPWVSLSDEVQNDRIIFWSELTMTWNLGSLMYIDELSIVVSDGQVRTLHQSTYGKPITGNLSAQSKHA